MKKNTEENYLTLLRERQLANDLYNSRIVKAKKRIHKEFVKSNKTIILILDILMICVVLFNIGAALMTNAMVVKAQPEVKFMETNIIQAKIQGYEIHPEAKQTTKRVIPNLLYYGFLIFIYLHFRRNLLTEKDLSVLLFIIIIWVTTLGFDFFNNFGYYIGRLLFGG